MSTRLRSTTLAAATAAVVLVSTPVAADGAKAAKKRTAKVTMPTSVLEHATVKVTSKFTPARRGARVQLQQRSGARWVTVKKAKQNAKGRATLRFAAPDAGRYSYRVRTLTKKGKVYARSKARVLTVKPRATALVSRRGSGAQLTATSYEPSVSSDGRYVAFVSSAEDLARDGNGVDDVFVTDTRTGRTVLVSRTPAGRTGNAISHEPAISANGRFVSFSSRASDLVAGSSSVQQVYRFDRTNGSVVRVSRSSAGARGNSTSNQSTISRDGRFVAYATLATNLTVETTIDADQWRIFVTDVDGGSTRMVSRNRVGRPSVGQSHVPSISADGRYVAFASGDDNLVVGDTNGRSDVFVHDRVAGTTRLVSRPPLQESDGDSGYPSINENGRYVAYVSRSSNIVAGDTNGKDDILRTDLQDSRTIRVSRTTSGATPSGQSAEPSISGDGRVVAYTSSAGGIVAGDGNGRSDVFAFTVSTGRTRLVSASVAGKAPNSGSFAPSLNRTGAVAVFMSYATNLVVRDGNGRGDVFMRRRP